MDNHVIWPGRAGALREFITQKHDGLNVQHKLRNAYSSSSEDALTWSCFDILRQVGTVDRTRALTELWQLAFPRRPVPSGVLGGTIHIGKSYGGSHRVGEDTEMDLSIEGPGVLVFFEAKLYSPLSPASRPAKPHDQIARKLRVGAREAVRRGQQQTQKVEFFFILLDLAPLDRLRALNPGASLTEAQAAQPSGFRSKWRTAYWFSRYKFGWKGSLKPLKAILADEPAVSEISASEIARNMGWLTWSDVFKIVLRAVVNERGA